MSTYFATFPSLDTVEPMIEELLRGGVRPEDVSVVSKESCPPDYPLPVLVWSGSVGDATSYVGRWDDPAEKRTTTEVADLTTESIFPMAGIDTSDSATNVESIDQADDSQSLAEETLDPRRMTSHSTHEVDDLVLAVETGFPTLAPGQDGVRDEQSASQSQATESLERIEIPGVGTVLGGGALATAALDVINPNDPTDCGMLMRFLMADGVPTEIANSYIQEFEHGHVLVSVQVSPGSPASRVEEIWGRHCAYHVHLIPAPGYYDRNGYLA